MLSITFLSKGTAGFFYYSLLGILKLLHNSVMQHRARRTLVRLNEVTNERGFQGAGRNHPVRRTYRRPSDPGHGVQVRASVRMTWALVPIGLLLFVLACRAVDSWLAPIRSELLRNLED